MNLVTKIEIQFFFQKATVLKERKRLKRFLCDLLVKKGKKTGGEVRIIFCSDDELLKINRNFLNHDFYTDIITFPFTAPESRRIDAELYISVNRVKDNAMQRRESFSRELHRVIFHGCLHLCGLGDKAENEIKQMRRAEEAALKTYFDVSRDTVSP